MSKQIIVGLGSCGIAAGGLATKEEFKRLIKEYPAADIKLGQTGCMGMCYREPMVEIREGKKRTVYGDVDPKRAAEIFKSHVIDGSPIKEYIVHNDKMTGGDDAFLEKQHRLVLARCGYIDPESIKDALAHDAYKGLEKALSMTPEEVIEEVKKSGLRGRGGAGFPTGLKWSFARKNEADQKYILCNGDEGDPGAFMDRGVLEGDPHAVLEGLIIGGYAIGASHGVFYVRDEYGLALKHLQKAMDDAREAGYLGKNILGSGFDFDCEIVRGGGAFVCGEETALIKSIEGSRGEPRPRPPFPAEKGLFGKPTNNNNVETYANIGWILRNGADEFIKLGTATSPGTKVFSLVGKVNRTGLVEIPMGMPLRTIVEDIGGGIKDGRKFKAVQTGGPSGGCIPDSCMDLEVDFDTLSANGSMMGSGGLIVMDETTCMVELAGYYVNFLCGESCGKCTPCREGLRCMSDILERICDGRGRPEDIDTLEEIGRAQQKASLCALGKTAANPVLSTLKHFRKEYEEHINEHHCSAGVCRALIKFSIDPDKCRSCGLCAKKCPVGAISGELKKPYVIDPAACTRCGNCFETCRFGAVSKE